MWEPVSHNPFLRHWACSGGKFVVPSTGEGYDSQIEALICHYGTLYGFRRRNNMELIMREVGKL
jgi:hypothetical protein